MNWVNCLWYFLIMSFLGWIFSCSHSYFSEKKFYNKGFLTLPFCPAYGVSGVICYLVFEHIGSNPLITFVGSALLISLLSLILGIVLEKILGCKPWDYSQTKLSIGSYISVPNSIMLGIYGVFTVHMFIPLLNTGLALIPHTVSVIICLSLCGVMVIDAILSLITVIRLRRRVKRLKIEVVREETGLSPEKTEEFTKNYNMLFTNSMLRKRMVNAYPELKSSAYVKMISDKLTEIKAENIKQYELVYENKEDRPFASGLCLEKLFILFLIGSFIGTCIETIYAPFAEGHFELRVGMVYGPFIPVYGGGAVLLTLVLYKLYKLSDIALFILSAFLGAFFEYMSSWFQETFLGTVSWDYSDMPLNINGRTSLMYAFIWGFLGLVWVRYLYPFASKWIEKIPKKPGSVVTAFLTLFMIFNALVTVFSIARWDARSNNIPPQNSIDRYLDEKFNDDRMELLFPHMRDSADLTELKTGKKSG